MKKITHANPAPLTNHEKSLIQWIRLKGHKWAMLNHPKEYKMLAKRGLLTDPTKIQRREMSLNNGRVVETINIKTPTGMEIIIKENYRK